jgi:hypothetical protein
MESQIGGRAKRLTAAAVRGFDLETLSGFASKLTNAIGGFLTAMAAAKFLSLSEQGLFFTLISFGTVPGLFELGLMNVIVQFVSHETSLIAAALTPEESARATGRLASIFHFALAWFALCAIGFFFIGGFGGYLFFRGEPLVGLVLPWPWALLVFALAVDLASYPLWGLLEGMGRIREVYTYRSLRALIVSVSAIGALAFGWKLYAIGLGFALTLPLSLFMALRFRATFWKLFRHSHPERVRWRKEILPMQSRLALTVISFVAVNWAIAPIALKVLGSETAGRIGMTWTMATAVGSLSMSVLLVKLPYFGFYVATRRFEDLDRLAVRQSALALALAITGAASVIGLVLLLEALHVSLASRFLPPLAISLVMIGMVAQQTTIAMSYYLRAFKREPLVWQNAIVAACVVASTVWLGGRYGVYALCAGYAAIMLFIALPSATIMFIRCRRLWRTPWATAPSNDGPILAAEHAVALSSPIPGDGDPLTAGQFPPFS